MPLRRACAAFPFYHPLARRDRLPVRRLTLVQLVRAFPYRSRRDTCTAPGGIIIKSRLITLLILLCAGSLPVLAEDDGAAWKVRRDRDGIEVSVRPVEGSPHAQIRARMVLDVSVASIVALLRDKDACRDWIAYCAEARVLERFGKRRALSYTWTDMPWPIRDRDVVARVYLERDAASGVVRFSADADPEALPEESGRVRLRHASTRWVLTPTGQGIDIELRTHVDPASAVPAWILNSLIVDAPHGTLSRMRDLLQSGRYAEADLALFED